MRAFDAGARAYPHPRRHRRRAAAHTRCCRPARVGGEGGTDYIFADVACGRRIYITRNTVRAVPATATTPAHDRDPRPGVRVRHRNTQVDRRNPRAPRAMAPRSIRKSGHGFSSDHPDVAMWDTKTMQLIKKIPADSGFGPDGHSCGDSYKQRVYVFSHPTKSAEACSTRSMVKFPRPDGNLGGVPEQGVADGKAGTLYVVMQDAEGGVAKVDVNTMKTVAHFPFHDQRRLVQRSLRARREKSHFVRRLRHVRWIAARGRRRQRADATAARQLPNPMMVILSADDGHIITSLLLGGGLQTAPRSTRTRWKRSVRTATAR